VAAIPLSAQERYEARKSGKMVSTMTWLTLIIPAVNYGSGSGRLASSQTAFRSESSWWRRMFHEAKPLKGDGVCRCGFFSKESPCYYAQQTGETMRRVSRSLSRSREGTGLFDFFFLLVFARSWLSHIALSLFNAQL